MKTHVIYLARHGETSWNRQKRWQGQSDIPLNDTGKSQAKALALTVGALGIEATYSSQLLRAKETAEIAAAELGIPYAGHDARLAERSFGKFEGLTRAEVELRYPKQWRLYQADRRELPPGGESFDALIERLRPALLAQLKEPPVLIVTHGGCMRSLWADHEHRAQPASCDRGPANHMPKIPPIDNCEVMKLEARAQSGELAIDRISLIADPGV